MKISPKLQLRTSILLTGILLPVTAMAQEPAETPAAAETAAPAAAEAATTEPAAEASEPAPAQPAPAQPTNANIGAIVQMGDSGDGPAMNLMGAGGSGGNSAGSVSGPSTGADDDWNFSYHGFFRAPMRIGVGERSNAKQDQAKTTLSTPQLPNDQYLNWQYTQTNERSWAEMFFGYGNKYAKGVVAMGAYNFTDAGFNLLGSQNGINQAWVELTPDMSSINEDMRMKVKVGSFWALYGGAGRYDAGAYDAFIFGRTHAMGETIRVEYDYNDYIFFFEEGFGTKMPDSDPNHNTKFTLLAHAHAGFNWEEFLDFNVHVLHSWTQEPDHECISREEQWAVQADNGIEVQAKFSDAPVGACKGEPVVDGEGYAYQDSPDGSMSVLGAEVILNTSGFGRIFLGASRIIADHAVTVAPAIEVIHAYGGGYFNMGVTHQYLLGRNKWLGSPEVPNPRSDAGNGTIDTLAGQWDLSLSSLIGADALGQHTWDLTAFFMANLIASEDDAAMDGLGKLKFGVETVYNPLSWFGVGLRADQVNPRSDTPEQNFTALAGRLIFRSDFGTHEELNIGVAKYLYSQQECDFGLPGADMKCVQPPTATVQPYGWYNRPGLNANTLQRGGPVDGEGTVTGPFPNEAWDPPHDLTMYISANIWW